MSLPATTEKRCCFGYNHDLSRSLLGCLRAPKIAATSGSKYDLTTGHYRSKSKKDWTSLLATTEELCCFGYFDDISRSLLGCWRCPRSQPGAGQGSHLTTGQYGTTRVDYWTSLLATKEELCCFGYFDDLFTLVARVPSSTRDHSYEWIKGGILSVDTIEASKRKIGRHYQPQQRNLAPSDFGDRIFFWGGALHQGSRAL